MISSQELKQVKNIKGKIRGTAFKNDFDYVKRAGGEEQLEKVKKRLEELGCKDKDILQEKIKLFSWHPLWCHSLFFLVLYKEMGWKKEDLFNIGHHGAKVSLVLRVLPKQFFDLKKIFKRANTYWRNNFSIGTMELKDFDLEKRFAVFDLKNFKAHPLQCHTIRGYFVGFFELLSGKIKNVQAKETQCVHQGAKFHQFQITWDNK